VSPVAAFLAAEMAEAVDPRVTEMASAIAAPYGEASRAVLFYGSCLRESQLDGLMLDFYLIVSSYEAAWPDSWLARANRLIPPNVFPFAHDGLAAKYAVLSEADFAALNGVEASTVSVWARFSQPVRLVWQADEAARDTVLSAIEAAPATLFALAAPLSPSADPLDIWRTGYAHTYDCELRAERSGRSGSIIDSDPDRYAALGGLIPPAPQPLSTAQAESRWAKLRRHGKLMSVVRLAKASLTFAGGVDYLVWKINRHAGTQIQVTPWQRRWPILAAITLVPRLLKQGAIK
jgi:hypothetical protein